MCADSINIKILNAGAWSRGSDRVMITLPTELEDLIPQVEEFYRKKHNGRKLQWHHLLSTGTVSCLCQPHYNCDLNVYYRLPVLLTVYCVGNNDIFICFVSQITFVNEVGRYDLEVTTFQMAVLFAWNQRQHDKLSYESLRLATELPDAELRRTLFVSFLLDIL